MFFHKIIIFGSYSQVSWIRRRDFQLLTVGLSTYSSDDRFLVEHARHMGHWSLRIKSVRDEDKGLYECQLNLYPTVSIFVELKVVGEYKSTIYFIYERNLSYIFVTLYEEKICIYFAFVALLGKNTKLYLIKHMYMLLSVTSNLVHVKS